MISLQQLTHTHKPHIDGGITHIPHYTHRAAIRADPRRRAKIGHTQTCANASTGQARPPPRNVAQHRARQMKQAQDNAEATEDMARQCTKLECNRLQQKRVPNHTTTKHAQYNIAQHRIKYIRLRVTKDSGRLNLMAADAPRRNCIRS